MVGFPWSLVFLVPPLGQLVHLDAMIRHGISLARSVEFTAQWDRILALGPLHPVTLDDLDADRGVGVGVGEGVDGARVLGDEGIGRDLFPHSVGHAGGSFESRVLGGFTSFRLNRKTPAHLARVGNFEDLQSRSKVWKRLRVSGAHWCSVCDSHVLHECHHCGDGSSLDDRVGVG